MKRWFGVLLVGLVPGRALAQPAPEPPSHRFGLAITGGVSLGAYEAGVNWALMEALRDANLSTGMVEGMEASYARLDELEIGA